MNLLSYLFPSAFAATIPNPNVGGLSTSLVASVQDGMNGAFFAVGGIIFLMFIYLGIKMIIAAGDESQQREVKAAFSHIVFGTILIGGSRLIASSFSPTSTGGGLGFNTANGTLGVTDSGYNSVVNDVTTNALMANIVTFIFGVVTIALISAIVYQAIRMIIAQDEGEVTTARKRLLEGLFGAAVVILSHQLVAAFDQTSTPTILPNEAAGIAQFLATVFGFLAVIGIIYGGVMMVASVDDSFKDNGKKAIIASLVALVVVYASYALVSLFIAPPGIVTP